MALDRLVFRTHALVRMHERGVSVAEVRHVIQIGEVIEDYPNSWPFPSRLVLGWIDLRPLHVVVATNVAERETINVTVYEPDRDRWSEDLKTRIKS